MTEERNILPILDLVDGIPPPSQVIEVLQQLVAGYAAVLPEHLTGIRLNWEAMAFVVVVFLIQSLWKSVWLPRKLGHGSWNR